MKVKVLEILLDSGETLDAYKFQNGLVMIGQGEEFVETIAELQQWDDSTVVSIKETGEEEEFVEKEILEMFLVELYEQGSYNVPISHFLRLLLLERS